jgi:hypothetical protein
LFTKWLKAVVKDLQRHRGRSIVLAGDAQPAPVHAFVHAINDALGNIGSTIEYIPPAAIENADASTGIRAVTEALNAERVKLLLILEGIRRISGFRMQFARLHWPFTTAFMTTRLRHRAIGISRQRITWSRGATCGHSTVPRRSFSR